MNKLRDDDIDLFKVFETLWAGKKLIFSFVIVLILFASGYIMSKTPVYESKYT